MNTYVPYAIRTRMNRAIITFAWSLRSYHIWRSFNIKKYIIIWQRSHLVVDTSRQLICIHMTGIHIRIRIRMKCISSVDEINKSKVPCKSFRSWVALLCFSYWCIFTRGGCSWLLFRINEQIWQWYFNCEVWVTE